MTRDDIPARLMRESDRGLVEGMTGFVNPSGGTMETLLIRRGKGEH